MNNDRLEKLRSLLQTVNESITKQEFVTSFKAVLDFVKQIDAKNTAEFDNFKVQFKHLANSLKLDTEGELDDLKTKVDSTLKDCMAEMMVEHDAKLQAMDKKMSELRDGLDGVDGKDADEHKVMEMVLAKIPPLELEPLDVVEKLESLQGEYRLDASAIKNLPEGKGSSWRGGGSRYLRNLADVTLTNLADGEAIVWDTTTGQFINSAVASSGVDTANSPQANEFARFTDADTIEGRTTSEVLSDLGFTASITELNYTDGVTSAIQDQINAKANSSGALTQFVGNTAWRVFYSDANGDITELALGADGTFLKSNGASAAPTFAVPAGSGDVTKVGTPLNNQVGVWTGDGTIEGDADLTFDTTTNTLATGVLQSSTLTASEIVITDGSKNLVSAAVATYPSLTELTYLKGVTSALQTQLNAKQGLDTQLTDLAGLSYAGNSLKVVRVNVGETGFELAAASGGVSIGDTIGSATATRLLYAGAAGVLAQTGGTVYFSSDSLYFDQTGTGNSQDTKAIYFKPTFSDGTVYSTFGVYAVGAGANTYPEMIIGSTNASHARIRIRSFNGAGETIYFKAADLDFSGVSGPVTMPKLFLCNPGESPPGSEKLFIRSTSNIVLGIFEQASPSATPVEISYIHNNPWTGASSGGAFQSIRLRTDTTDRMLAADWTATWATATHASRKARATFNVYDTAIREAIRIEASGSAPMVGFYGTTAVVQAANTTDLGTVLSDVGLRASGTAYPITTSGNVSFTGTIGLGGQVTVSDAINFALNTTTGTKFGTGTTQKLSFWNATPIVQPANTVAIDDVLVNTGLRASGGTANFTTDVSVPDEAYGVGWNGSLEVPTKNAVYDKIETLSSGFTWTEVTGTSQAAAVNNGYIANNAALVTITLPDTAAVGSIVRVVGKGAGGWRIAQNASEQIIWNEGGVDGTDETTIGVGGRLDSTDDYDAIELICITADTTWTVLSSKGNITLT